MTASLQENVTDPAGRLACTRAQAWDSLGRLAQVLDSQNHATQGYAYDANGNRSQLSSNSALTQYAYSANRLTNSTGSAARTYTYDAAGRMTGDGNYTYSYNALGRLVTVQSGSRNIGSYAYNALGQRVSKAGVRFVHDESGHLLGEYDQRGNLIQELVWLEGLPVASLRPGPKSGKTTVAYYIHPDHLGTPRQITDSSNQIVWRWDSPDPFGSALPDENPDNGKGKRNGAFEFNLRFPGQYYDKETGRNDNWWRVYDSGTGRYTTSDPIGLGGGWNRYAYVHGNPISYTDPLGLTEYGPLTESVSDFLRNYNNMRDAHTIGADKYFHCMANCEAAKRGPVGDVTSKIISEVREQIDEHVKGDPPQACNADRAANNQGRSGGKNSPDTSCSSTCQSLRPNGLNPMY